MAFLEGLLGGIGQGAREVSNNMLEAQLQKYKSAGKIWESMAADENYHPNIRQQFLDRAHKLYSANPMQRGSVQEADKIIKTDPSKAAQEAYKAMEMMGISPGKYYNQQGYRGAGEQIQLASDMERAKQAAQMEGKMSAAGVQGDDFHAMGVPPDHPFFKDIVEWNKRAFATGKSPEQFQRVPLGGHPGSFWPPTGRYAIGKMEVDPHSITLGGGGQQTAIQILRDEYGNEVGRKTITLPQLSTPAPMQQQAPGAAVAPPAGSPMPQVAPPPAPGLPAPPQNVMGPQPAPATGGAFEWDPETNNWFNKHIPGDDPISRVARQYAMKSEEAIKEVNGNKFVRQKVMDRLARAGVWMPNTKQSETITLLDEARHTVQTIGSLMKHVQDNPWDLATAYRLHKQIMSLGSVFAKANYLQTGQLSNQEQEWARKGFSGARESLFAGFMKWLGSEGLSQATFQSLDDVLRTNDIRRQTLMKGKPVSFIGGYGTVQSFFEAQDPTKRELLRQTPMDTKDIPNRKYKSYGYHPDTKQQLGSDDEIVWYDVATGQLYDP